jgi:cytochrome P450
MSIEISNLVFAATDTTGNTLTYLFFELALNPKWQEKLRIELKSINFTDDEPSYQDIKSLPVLNSVIWETLRVHPAAPASLPRVAPVGGGNVAGVYLPEGTLASSQAYTTQRLTSAFPEPDTYNPTRWIETDGGTDEMKELMLAFGKGTRGCLGKTMSLMEMKIATAALIKKYAVRLASEKTVDDMEMTDHFTLIPKGQRCLLVFERVGEKGE